jgi:ArsR family transcriptional regulator
MTATVLEPPIATSKPLRLTRARRTALLKALADPRRFELLEKIARAGCPLGCAQARAALPISAATLSHHIKELETAGLIHIRREGKFHYMSLRPGVLESWPQRFRPWNKVPAARAERPTRKRFPQRLESFLPGCSINSIVVETSK